MNAHTPSISAVDPRGLSIRAIGYYRLAADKPVTARVAHQVYDPLGRLIQQRDPRLFALSQSDASIPANLTTIHTLIGQALCSDSVDAGWQLGLPGAAGQALESWDQRGWHRRTGHDPLLRPVTVHEQVSGEPERCVERMTFGGVSDDHARHNRCGQPIRQDDPAGSRLMVDYGLSAAAVLRECRYFLNTFDPVDWPALEADRDNLLEPGAGAESMWSFAPTSEVLGQTDAKGHRQHFTHDRAGQLRSVGLQQSDQGAVETLVSSIEYSAFGQVEQEMAGNGVRTTSAYDPANGRLMHLSTQAPDQGYLQKLSYGYDPAGNITEIADAALPIQYFANQRIEPVRRFAYDTLYQLISATGWETAKPSLGPALPEWQAFGPADASRWSNYTETYHYDAAGNLQQRIHHGAVDDTLTMKVAPHSNRSVKIRSGQPGIDELFDLRGNLLELQPGQALQWNGRNQLAGVTLVARTDGSDDEERYVYDSEGARLRKYREVTAKSIVHTAEVRYLPGIELHANSATAEQLQVISVQAGRCTVRLLHWDSPPPAGLENDQLRYCFDDHLGSSAFEVDTQAKTISQEVYYPFGGTAWLAGRHEVETCYKTIRYSGKERDATGLYYYGARYYAPWLQRWLNPDLAGDVDGLNFYRFVRNSPLNFVDRKGYLPGFFDFLIEPKDVRDRVEQRGWDNIRMHMPEIAEILEASFLELKTTLTYAMAELESEHLDKEVVEHFFGAGQATPKNIEYFRKGYHQMLLDIGHIKNNQERLVAISGEKEKAFIYRTDTKRKIYFDYEIFEAETVGENTFSLGHELTHLSPIFESYDYWYFRSDVELMEGMSNNIMHDQFVLMSSFSGSEEGFVSKAGAMNKEGAVDKFNKSTMLRKQLALHNADTLMGFAFVLSRNAQLRR
ncbi:RHS repeat-associated core domain protein [Pseudomonas fluorescens]|uniref:RHS repeat-associated core domain protein n=1 Tax=Pseudomonas fluorescens TaxID=294 RepID=A0A0P8Z3Z0_PSEFL|nr:RHS repeat-associated core domain-containing protein [Pseudomonas fluorescens]KPU59746.1 RHS repeat-associated core domain protein [Pseudomonas fluorescens]